MTPYYQDDGSGITIHQGGCRDILPQLALADHVVTDPPYDEETHTGARTLATVSTPEPRSGGRGHRGAAIPIAFDPVNVEAVVPLLLAAAHRWVIAFCSLELLGDYRRRLVRRGFARDSGAVPMVRRRSAATDPRNPARAWRFCTAHYRQGACAGTATGIMPSMSVAWSDTIPSTRPRNPRACWLP